MPATPVVGWIWAERPAAASSCRRRWDRASPSARPPRRSSRRRRAGVDSPRRTVTSASSRTATMAVTLSTAPRSWRRRIVARRDRPARHRTPRAAGVRDARVVGDRLAARPRGRPTWPSTRSPPTTGCTAASDGEPLAGLLGRLRAARRDRLRAGAPRRGRPAGPRRPAGAQRRGARGRRGRGGPGGRARPGARTCGDGGRDLAVLPAPAAGSCPTSARPTGRCGARRSRPPRRWPRWTWRGGGPRRRTC